MNQIRSTGSAAALVVALMALQGCRDNVTGPHYREGLIQTAQSVYVIPTGTNFYKIDATITNKLDEPILLDGWQRDFYALEKLVDGGWQLAMQVAHLSIAVPRVELLPGQVQPYAIWIQTVVDPTESTALKFEIPGTYRAVFGFARYGANGYEAIIAHSNEFDLRLAQ